MNERRIIKGALCGFEEETQNQNKIKKKMNTDIIKELQVQTQKYI